MLYLYVVRHSLFPRTTAEWTQINKVVPLASQCLVQLLLIVMCFAIGRGLGGIVGIKPPISLTWALGLSFLAVPLCRLIAIQPLPTSGPAAKARVEKGAGEHASDAP